jgi:hypothetical protein
LQADNRLNLVKSSVSLAWRFLASRPAPQPG